MDFQLNNQNSNYQSTRYNNLRSDKKTLILDIKDDTTNQPLGNGTDFSVNLYEPLIIDKLCDIYLDTFISHNSKLSFFTNNMAFILNINEFKINTNVASTDNTDSTSSNIFNSILIPNEHDSENKIHTTVVHKGKKMNYICSINPCRLSTLSGRITNLAGSNIFVKGRLFSCELTTGANAHHDEDDDLFFTGTSVQPSSGPANFKLALSMNTGATTVYFYKVENASSEADTIDSVTTGEDVTSILGGVRFDSTASTLLSIDSTSFRIVGYPRFAAEFLIVPRE